MAQVSLPLIRTVKELQLQNGLRQDDYAKYHHYLAGRVATLRKQLRLASEYKIPPAQRKGGKARRGPVPFVAPKPVTAKNAQGPRHILLAALLAERAWADAESAAQAAAGTVSGHRRHVNDAGRKRFNKAAKLAVEAADVATTVGDERLAREAAAYVAEMKGRCAAAHQRYEEALALFVEAHAAYAALSAEGDSAVFGSKATECADRVVFCSQQSGAPVPAAVTQGINGGDEAAGTVQWLGRDVPVTIIRVKEALRSIGGPETAPAVLAQKMLDELAAVQREHGALAGAWWMFQQSTRYNKLVDAFDRALGEFNAALDAVKTALRDAEKGGPLRLLQLYLTYQQKHATLCRTLFVAAHFRARFTVTEEFLASGKTSFKPALGVELPGLQGRKETAFAAQHVATPVELERLYGAAVMLAEDLADLPGVEDHPRTAAATAALLAKAQAERCVVIGDGWRVVGDTARAKTAFATAVAVCESPDAVGAPDTFDAEALGADAKAATVAMAARQVLDGAPKPAFFELAVGPSPKEQQRFAIDHLDEHVPCSGLVPFPPDFQTMPAKPAFVDIASTYLDYPPLPTDDKPKHKDPAEKAGGGWLGGWLGGRK